MDNASEHKKCNSCKEEFKSHLLLSSGLCWRCEKQENKKEVNISEPTSTPMESDSNVHVGSNTFSYIWNVTINIATLVIAGLIFSTPTSNFERVILSIVIILFLSIKGFFSVWGINQISFEEKLRNEFDNLKNQINPNGHGRLNEYEKRARAVYKKEKKNILVKFYINSIFNSLIYIVAILNLLGVL